MYRVRPWLSGLVLLWSCTADAAAGAAPMDLYFGEAIFKAHQGDYFDAIARLDTELGQYHGVDEPELDSLYTHIGEAEFSVGDFELSYRMHNRAGRAIRAVVEGNVAPAVRNEAAYRLARIYFQKGQPVEAQHALDRISGSVPERIRDDVAFLRAQVHMASGRFTEAVAILKDLQGAKGLEGFSAYNLGIALFLLGRPDDGSAQLDKAGQVAGNESGALAIRDKSNLVLGTRLLENNKFDLAKQYLDRVRLKGPFSNRALLSSGWADASADRYERSLIPWSILAKRNVTDKAVQEALLAVPYAYGKLNLHGKAALLYGGALEAFSRELTKLDASIVSIREGRFLKALVREEIKQDSNWVIKLRELPETPETYYLMELMASHDFQSSLKNYLDLEALRSRLVSWSDYYDSFEEIIQLRMAYYEPLLPEIDKQFRVLDSQLKLRFEQRDHLNKRIEGMLIAPRPDLLATAEERIYGEDLAAIEESLAGEERTPAQQVRARISRLKGVLLWRIHTDYDERLTQAYTHLRELDQDIVRLKNAYGEFVRTRQAATQSYRGYDESIRRLRSNTREALDKVGLLMARQGHLLETTAIAELDLRRQRLEEYQVKARFALADSYDRATKAAQEKASQPSQ